MWSPVSSPVPVRCRKWCLLKCVYVLFALLLCVLFFPPSVTGMAVLNLNGDHHHHQQDQQHQQQRDVQQYQQNRQTMQPHQRLLTNFPFATTSLSAASGHGFGANVHQRQRRREAKSRYRVNANDRVAEVGGDNTRLVSNTAAATSNSGGVQYCHARDPSTRAYLAPAVFEGKVKSMNMQGLRSNYSVVFQVIRVHKNRGGGKLEPFQYVKLQFARKLGDARPRCGLRRERAGLVPGGLVPAVLQLQRVYLVFLQRRDAKNYTVLGEPVPVSERAVQAVMQGVGANYGKPAVVTQLLDASGRLGGRAKLVCRVSGQPPPRVTWFKDGAPIRNQRTDQRIRIRHLRRRSVLQFQNLTRDDAGRYECRARGGPGSPASARALLTVILPPEMTSTTTTETTATECPHQLYCFNEGTCMFFKDVGEIACRCADGFTGQRCENKDVGNRSSRYPFQCKLGLSTSYYC